ncbi:ABC transporter permease [Nocardia sp. XZ_19_231]|uniref:ABC transporter permease n=1 Tax=Nocardia sp. XZ_19_231 TaxID=2769252 RepID=UPI00188F0E74|nr:ABC transporter permease [Nocardia sp. XZ_19_231]
MNPTLVAVRGGLAAMWIELRQLYTNGTSLMAQFLTPTLFLIAIFFLRDRAYQDTGLSLGELAVPGLLGSIIAFNGLYGIAEVLALDREDGTLLRAKTIPNGILGYFIGKVGTTAGAVLVQLVVVLTLGAVIVGGLSMPGGAAITLTWVIVLGLLATLPIGAILGGLIVGARDIFLLTLPLMGLIAISGIWYPVTALPGWIQSLAQLFPMYWLGLGMRSALLPAEAAAIEIDGSWRHLETAAVLGVWSIVGLLLAPIVLRRAARHESGSSVAVRREKAMQRAF